MKITDTHRSAICSAIMQDVPAPSHTEIKELAQTLLLGAMTPPVRRMYKTNPNALRTVYLTYDHGAEWTVSVIAGDADATAVLAPLIEAAQARRKAKKDLQGALQGCKTLRQLHTTLPEFAKYFPTEGAASANLPAVANVVAGLSALGWPKKGAAV